MIKSEIGHSTPSAITIRGLDLASDILGHLEFVEAMFLCALARRPTREEIAMVNALLVVALDHGLTPSSIAARLTFLSSPDNFPGAIAAGLLGAGSRYLGTSAKVARQFAGWTEALEFEGLDSAYDDVAAKVIATHKRTDTKLTGYGHPIHKPLDPRVQALRKVAVDNGFYGKGWRLADAIATRLSAERTAVPMNASGAVGVTILDMSLEPAFAIALTLVGRCGGLIAHLIEEMSSPIGQQIWQLIAMQDTRVDFGVPGSRGAEK